MLIVDRVAILSRLNEAKNNIWEIVRFERGVNVVQLYLLKYWLAYSVKRGRFSYLGDIDLQVELDFKNRYFAMLLACVQNHIHC